MKKLNITDILKDFKKGKLEIGSVSFSVNDKNENVIILVGNDYVKVTTLQKNGWARINTYCSDNTTTETYEK